MARRGTGPRPTRRERLFLRGTGPRPTGREPLLLRGTGPRATGREPLLLRGIGPRATVKKTHPLHVEQGPAQVSTRAGERVPLAMRFAVKPHHPCRSRSSEALACLPSDLDPFVIRRSQTTEVGPIPAGRRDLPVSMQSFPPRAVTFARDRPSPYAPRTLF